MLIFQWIGIFLLWSHACCFALFNLILQQNTLKCVDSQGLTISVFTNVLLVTHLLLKISLQMYFSTNISPSLAYVNNWCNMEAFFKQAKLYHIVPELFVLWLWMDVFFVAQFVCTAAAKWTRFYPQFSRSFRNGVRRWFCCFLRSLQGRRFELPLSDQEVHSWTLQPSGPESFQTLLTFVQNPLFNGNYDTFLC